MSFTHPLLAARFVRVEAILKTIASKRSTIVSLGDTPSQLAELQCAHSVLQSIDLSLALDSDKHKYKEYVRVLEREAELFEAIVARLVEVNINAMNLTGLIARADANQLDNPPPLNPYAPVASGLPRSTMFNHSQIDPSIAELLAKTPETVNTELNKLIMDKAKSQINPTSEPHPQIRMRRAYTDAKVTDICLAAVDTCIEVKNRIGEIRDVTVTILKRDLGVERLTQNRIDTVMEVMESHGLRLITYRSERQCFTGIVNLEHAIIHPSNIPLTSKA